MHGARNYFSYLLCLSSSCLCKDLHRSRSSPRPSLPRPPPANQWPDDADAYWVQKKLTPSAGYTLPLPLHLSRDDYG